MVSAPGGGGTVPGRERIQPAVTIAAGVLAAACLGKVAAVSVVVGQAFRLSPLALGAAISLITFVTAAVATPAGLWLRGKDARRWLAAGLAVMAVAGGAVALVPPSTVALICLRTIEGIGYLLIVVGGPGALAGQVSVSRRPRWPCGGPARQLALPSAPSPEGSPRAAEGGVSGSPCLPSRAPG
jgi:MFS family permease